MSLSIRDFAIYTLSYGVSLLTEPLGAYSKLRSSSYEDTKKEFLLEMEEFLRDNSTPLPSIVADRINAFIRERGFSPERIKLFECDPKTLYGSPFSAAGSFNEGEPAYIGISLKARKEIEINELNSEHKFTLLHEIGHLVAGDRILGEMNFNRRWGLTRLTAYSVTALALPLLFSTGYFTSHVVGCAVSRVVGRFLKRKNDHAKELRADRFAILNGTSETAEAGKLFFENARVLNMQTAQKNLMFLAEGEAILKERIKTNGRRELSSTLVSLQNICYFRYLRLKQYFLTSKEGDEFFSLHPPISQRLDQIKCLMAQNTKAQHVT